ncbi:hypothetical protein cce_4953 [Crocosphaera subtropica ATCC 51142]|uniref:Uncharacterized protein n=1 Tax=Crocosphaera subtropica (strain ATCC 51142 / BH68) TaxID=43989 RepID=B1X2D8_CROS5|nr:hypothetical protein [Crocosphaera subtropica]ACB54299.1 hypothetical protein cce_4953 [Crocosphaera subtropica ATCC 51142]
MPFFLMENECVLWCMRGAKSADYASAFMASDNHLSKINMAFQNLESVLDTLKTQGASTIEITYFGEGDDGAIEPPSLKTCTAGYDSEAIEAALDSGPGDTLIAFVEHILGPGWENGTGLSGTVIFDLTTDTITHSQEEEVIQCNYNEDTYTLNGDLLRSKTDNWEDRILASSSENESMSQHQKEYISQIESKLRETITERFLLDFWVQYPEVDNITLEKTWGKTPEGGWTTFIELKDIEFVSIQAMEELKKKLDGTSQYEADSVSG